MPRAISGSDPHEWVEIRNDGAVPADLRGCVLRDDGTNSHTITDLVVAPGAYAVLTRTAQEFSDYVYGTSFTLNNTGTDQIVLVCGATEVARVEYGARLVSLGVSAQLGAGTADVWCLTPPGYTFAVGDLTFTGTPGEPNAPCADVAVDWCRTHSPREATASAVGDTVTVFGRVFEAGLTDLTSGVDTRPDRALYAQAGFGPLDQNPAAGGAGWTWVSATGTPGWNDAAALPTPEPGRDEYTANFPSPEAGTYAIAFRFRVDDGAWLYCDLDQRAHGGGVNSDGSNDGFALADCGVLTVMGDSPCVPNPCDTPDALSRCDGDTFIEVAALGECTPGVGDAYACIYPETRTDCGALGCTCDATAGGCACPQPTVIITEFMANAVAGSDPYEWVEVTNVGLTPADLTGCVLKDDGSNAHTLGTLIVPPGDYVVLARTSHDIADYVYGTGFTLANAGDQIVIACDGVEVARVVYGAALAARGVSAQLAPGTTDTWCLTPSTATFVTADTTFVGTPGAPNVLCAD